MRDSEDNVRIWAQSDGATMTNLALSAGFAEEIVLICFAGILELRNLVELSVMLDAGQAKHLAKTTQPRPSIFR